MQPSPTAVEEVEYAAAAHNPDPELPPLLDPPSPTLQHMPELSRVMLMPGSRACTYHQQTRNKCATVRMIAQDVDLHSSL